MVVEVVSQCKLGEMVVLDVIVVEWMLVAVEVDRLAVHVEVRWNVRWKMHVVDGRLLVQCVPILPTR